MPATPDLCYLDPSFPVNWDWQPNRGLVAWYMPAPSFCGGTRWIEAVNRLHGTLTNMNPAAAWVPCEMLPGYAALHDGDDDYVNLGDHDLWTPDSQGLSVSLWARLDAATGSGRELIGKYKIGGREWAFAHRGGAPYQLRFFAFDESQTAYVGRTTTDDSPQDDGQWHHFVGIYDGGISCSGFAIHVDKVRVDTADYQGGGDFFGIENGGADLLLGCCSAWGGSNWLGPMTDVRIYRRPLSSGDVDAIYEDAIRGFPKSLNRLRRWFPVAPIAMTGPPYHTAVGRVRHPGAVAGGLYLTGGQAGRTDTCGPLAGQIHG